MSKRPSLNDLAAQHAQKHWPKKKRNAELRRWGYDPDGEHGLIYRSAFQRACQTERMADFSADLAEEAHVTFLWDVPDEQWREWIAQGCGDLPLSEYRERLAIVRARIESQGGVVVMVPATVAEVLKVIDDLALANDPQGRSAAIGLIGSRR